MKLMLVIRYLKFYVAPLNIAKLLQIHPFQSNFISPDTKTLLAYLKLVECGLHDDLEQQRLV